MSSPNVNLHNAMGKDGGTVIYGTSAITPTVNKSQTPSSPAWGVFYAGPAGATISAWSGTLENISQLYGVALPAGFVLYDPRITSITLSAGTGVAYYN